MARTAARARRWRCMRRGCSSMRCSGCREYGWPMRRQWDGARRSMAMSCTMRSWSATKAKRTFPAQTQLLHADSHAAVGPRRQGGIEPEFGDRLQPFLDEDGQFHARQMLADAAVHA